MIKRKELEELRELFSSVVNGFLKDDEIDEIADLICTDHRTLQQAKMRLVIAMLKRWSTDYKMGNYDLRNEQTCKVADNIITWIDEDQLYFPCI